MFCPKCRSEFVDLVDQCSDCGVQLVEKLNQEPPRLKNAVMSVVLGILYLSEPLKAIFGMSMSLLITFLIVGMIHSLYRQYEVKEHLLAKGIFIALVGSWVFSLLHLLDWINIYMFRSTLYSSLYSLRTCFFLRTMPLYSFFHSFNSSGLSFNFSSL